MADIESLRTTIDEPQLCPQGYTWSRLHNKCVPTAEVESDPRWPDFVAYTEDEKKALTMARKTAGYVETTPDVWDIDKQTRSPGAILGRMYQYRYPEEEVSEAEKKRNVIQKLKAKAQEETEWEERKHQMDVEDAIKSHPEMAEYIKDFAKNKDWRGLSDFTWKLNIKAIKPGLHPREIEAAEREKWKGRKEEEYQRKRAKEKELKDQEWDEEIQMTEYLRDKGYDIPSVPTPNIEDVKSLYKHEKAKETTELKEAEKPPTDYSLHDEGDRLLGYFRDDPVRHDAIKKGLMQGIPPKLLKRELMKRNVLPYSKDITGREDFKEAIKRLNLLKGGAGRKILHDLGYSDAEIDAMGIM